MGAVKRIKCPYCEHTGQSVLEESTPILAYLLSFALYLLAEAVQKAVRETLDQTDKYLVSA